MSTVLEKLKIDIAELKQEIERMKIVMVKSFKRIILAIEKLEAKHK